MLDDVLMKYLGTWRDTTTTTGCDVETDVQRQADDSGGSGDSTEEDAYGLSAWYEPSRMISMKSVV